MQLVINDRAGIRLNKNINALVVEASGHENFTFGKKYYRNYIEKIKIGCLQLKKRDTAATQEYFMKMQSDNFNFFYIVDLDEEGCLKNVFWSDERSKAVFKEFG